jgi:hypothetical protein
MEARLMTVDTKDMKDMQGKGRIDLLTAGGTPFFLQDKIPNNERTNYANTMKYSQQNTTLSTLFLSQENVKIIENAIKAGVYQVSNKKHVIDRQDRDTLYIIMRAIYLQYSLNQPDNITKQIEDMNERVVMYCVPRIYGEIQGYMRYKQDASTLVVPLENPSYYHIDKTLELKNFF